MRNRLLLLSMLLCSVVPASASAQVSIGIGFPNVSIGINLPFYPDLEPVPGYPVYYAPRLDTNYFFYDGLYWVYQYDDWYASSWYNGPWEQVDREVVPLYILRVPVRYYRRPPVYFRGWREDAPPRWGDHWGRGWEQHRSGWDRWDRRSAPAAAPLPVYQRQYSGNRYPRVDQQRNLRDQNYRYQSQEPVVRQKYEGPRDQRAPSPPDRRDWNPGQQGDQRHNPYLPQAPVQQDSQRYNPYLPQAPARQPTPPNTRQERDDDRQSSAPSQAQPQRRDPPVQQQNQPPLQGRDRNQPQESRSNQDSKARKNPDQQKHEEKDRGSSDNRGQDRNNR